MLCSLVKFWAGTDEEACSALACTLPCFLGFIYEDGLHRPTWEEFPCTWQRCRHPATCRIMWRAPALPRLYPYDPWGFQDCLSDRWVESNETGQPEPGTGVARVSCRSWDSEFSVTIILVWLDRFIFFLARSNHSESKKKKTIHSAFQFVQFRVSDCRFSCNPVWVFRVFIIRCSLPHSLGAHLWCFAVNSYYLCTPALDVWTSIGTNNSDIQHMCMSTAPLVALVVLTFSSPDNLKFWNDAGKAGKS